MWWRATASSLPGAGVEPGAAAAAALAPLAPVAPASSVPTTGGSMSRTPGSPPRSGPAISSWNLLSACTEFQCGAW